MSLDSFNTQKFMSEWKRNSAMFMKFRVGSRVRQTPEKGRRTYRLKCCPRVFTKGHSSKFRVGSRVRQTPKEGWRTHRPKRCWNNNKDKDNSPKTLNDKNHQALFQKFRQLIYIYSFSNIYIYICNVVTSLGYGRICPHNTYQP